MWDETAPVDVAERYRRFAEVEGDLRSPRYAEWARAIAEDAAVLDRIATLPRLKQQPNLIFAAIRFVGIATRPWAEVRDEVLARWDAVVACVRSHATQTNEARRLATLLPALASLPQPLALLEVGTSMGLCLYPDAWSYRYLTATGEHLVGDPGRPQLTCELTGPVPAVPQVAWRAGIDLHPLDAADPADVAWLETLVWPIGDGEPDVARLDRLHAAVAIARAAPARTVTGDLRVDTWPLLSEALAHRDAGRVGSVVVFHTAVLAYLSAPDRADFAAQVRASGAVWVANEGLDIVPGVADQLAEAGIAADPGDFCLAVNTRPYALADGHGRWVRVLPERLSPKEGTRTERA